jgi:hypothetical protein
MRITETQLRRIIREELLAEDLAGFMRRTQDIDYAGDPERDPTFERDPSFRPWARDVKRAWSAEADHAFMRRVVKIHWLKEPSGDSIRKLVTEGGRDEISTMGYINEPYSSGPGGQDDWGFIGLVIVGRTTLAANNMDDIYSGYHSQIPAEVREKYKSSGTRRRSVIFSKSNAGSYILDEESFDKSAQGNNEFVVSGWRVKSFVLSRSGAIELKHVIGDAYRGIKNPYWSDRWDDVLGAVDALGIPYLKQEQVLLADEWRRVRADQVSS